MLLDHLGNLISSHFHIGDLILARLKDLHHRLELADADAAGLGHGDAAGQARRLHLLHKGVQHRTGTGGDAAGGHTHHDPLVTAALPQSNLILHSFLDRLEFC